MINKELIGYKFPPVKIAIEESRLKFFAKAINEDNLIYNSIKEARKNGHKSLLAPPTFPFVIDMDAIDLNKIVNLLKKDLKQLLHGEQSFQYFAPIYSGDLITIYKTIEDIYSKKNGKMEFIIVKNEFENQNGIKVVSSTTNYIIRN